MVDRSITYTQAVPRSQDFLQNQKNVLNGLGYMMQAICGQPAQIFNNVTAWVDGLHCDPVAPAALQITVSAGSIYMMEPMDATPYGVLGLDANQVLKQGISLNPVPMNITPPSTSGYSQYYVIQAIYNDVDTGPVVLPYYNSANPLIPLGGPANSGQQQFTIRQGQCIVALKVGVAAPTGTQTIPPADAGYTALWSILVTNGQTQITSGNIAQIANAPFISPKLTQIPPAIQAQKDNYAADLSGSATPNAMAITLPSFTNVVAGLTLRIIKSAYKNTTSPTLSINGGAPQNIAWADGSVLQTGDWPGGAIGQITYNGSYWELYTIAGPTIFARVAPGSSPTVTDASLLHYGVDTGTPNAAVCASVTPAITSTVTVGTAVEIEKINTANTGSMTVSITATGGTVVAPLYWPDGNALQAGDWPQSALALVAFDGTYYRLLSVTQRPVTFPQGAYVHYLVSTGINTLTGTSTPVFTSIVDGIFLEMTPTAANTGPVTLAANGLGAAAITTVQGANLVAGQLQANQPVLLMALGGQWKLFGGVGASGSGITNIQVIYSSGTYIPSAGTQKSLVFCTAGGGAGGVQLSCGGGGGAGGTAFNLIPMAGISSVPVVVGGGGAGVTAAPNGASAGGAGGTTAFGGYAIATGGGGGSGATGGGGGFATAGYGVAGGEGSHAVSNVILGSGTGGSSFWGGGGQGSPTLSGQGDPAYCFGAGGGGGDSGYAVRTGGNGAQGLILVLEF